MDGNDFGEKSLLQDLVEKIAGKIFSGVYTPGQKLRQEALAEEYCVSRTPVREALRQLEIKGLVTQQMRFGVTVVAPTINDIGACYWLRSELECMATELASKFMTDADLQRLQAVHISYVNSLRVLYESIVATKGASGQQVVEPMRDWILKNQEFHALIYKNSGNALLGQIVSNLHLDYVKNVLSMMAPNMYESRIKKNIEHHSAIVEAMVARDSIAARHAMRTHIQESSEFVVDWLQKRPVPLRSRSGRSNLSV